MTHPFPAARTRVALLCLLALAGTCTGTHARAQAADPHAADPHAADSHAAVPATHYENAIRFRVEPPPATRPDRNWRDSNAVVAGTPAMSMTMPGMADHAAHGGGAAPESAPEPAPAAAPHHHHPGMAMPATPQETKR